MVLEALLKRISVRRNISHLAWALVLGALLIPAPILAAEKHDDDSVLDDASLLRRRLEEVLNPKTETTAEEDETEEDEDDTGVEIKSVPTSVSLVALTIGKGLTPKRLNNAIERLKEAEDSTELSQAARGLAALLNLDPEEFKKKYEKLNGELDFEQIFKDLTLDGAEFAAQRTALKKALEDENQGPVQEEEETEEDEEDNEDDGTDDDGGVDDGVGDEVLGVDDFDDGTAFDPADGELGDAFLDDALNNNELADDDLDDDLEEVLNDNANDRIKELEDQLAKNRADLEDAKNRANKNNNNKNAGNKNPGNPPPPEQPAQIPPISPAQPGPGSKNPGIQPTKMPNPVAAPEFNPPTPVGDVPLSPDVVNGLLGRDRNAKRDAERREDKVQQILDSYKNMNQTAIQTILQIGARQSATIGAGPRSRTTTTSTPQGGGFSDRLRSFSGARGAPGQSGPRRSGSGPGLNLGTGVGGPVPPGYGARKIRGR